MGFGIGSTVLEAAALTVAADTVANTVAALAESAASVVAIDIAVH